MGKVIQRIIKEAVTTREWDINAGDLILITVCKAKDLLQLGVFGGTYEVSKDSKKMMRWEFIF